MSSKYIEIDQEMISAVIKAKEATKGEEEIRLYKEVVEGKSLEEISISLQEKIKADEVAKILTLEPTADNGGVIALSGFYFQFLTSIEYLVELIEDKWDYLIIDHHQDIILINNEKIRIIQVKTNNKEYSLVSQTKLYNDWIQKLFSLDKLFKDFSQKTEFELITNFLIQNSPEVKMEVYHSNNRFDMNIQKNKFFEKVESYSREKGYLELEGKNLEELLSKFKITRKESKEYMAKIGSDIGSIYNPRFKATKEDIDYLIGYICSTCYYPTNPSVQFIDKEKAMKINEILRGRFTNDIRDYIEESDSITKVDIYIKKLHEVFKDSSFYEELEIIIQEFELGLKSRLTGSNNIYSVLSRFIKRIYSSSSINISNSNEIDNSVKELLDLTFFLKLIYGGEIEIDNKHNKLLLKVIGDKNFNFFNLVDTDDFEEANTKFMEIFNMCDFEEKKILFKDDLLNIIFSGDFNEEDFFHGHIIELDFTDSPSEKEMENLISNNKQSISKVIYKVQYLNGNNSVIKDFYRKRRISSITDYKDYINTKLR